MLTMRKPETKFRQTQVIPFLKSLERTVFFPVQQSSIRGDFDFVLCVYGWFVGMELKDDDGLLDALQAYKATCVRHVDGIAFVAKPSNWHDVKIFLGLLNGGIYDKNALRRISGP